jgi:hypothetical protein
MGDENKNNAIIPGLLAGAAIYFGLTNNAGRLADLAQSAMSRVISDQMPRNSAGQLQGNRHGRKRNKRQANLK